MRGSVVPLAELGRDGGSGSEVEPELVLAFVPPGHELDGRLAELEARWPASRVVAVEAVTQFAGSHLRRDGVALLLGPRGSRWSAEIAVVPGRRGEPLALDSVREAVALIRRSSGALLLADGLRFPVQAFLARLRAMGVDCGRLAGGLASQAEPVEVPLARVATGGGVVEAGAVVVGFSGVEVAVEIVRGWEPAGPRFTVTKAAGNVLYELEGEPATRWYEALFTVGGELAPLPETAYRFPLIVDGPRPERRGLYRSMRWFDRPPGAVTYWGDLVEGDRVRLGIGDGGSLARGAARVRPTFRPEAAVVFSCVGRELVLGDRAGEEAAALSTALGEAPLAGFFTFGEVGPAVSGRPAFYNQTAVLALFRETGA